MERDGMGWDGKGRGKAKGKGVLRLMTRHGLTFWDGAALIVARKRSLGLDGCH
jgi:hypothetical protein